jgi:hypothetical protein
VFKEKKREIDKGNKNSTKKKIDLDGGCAHMHVSYQDRRWSCLSSLREEEQIMKRE